MSKSAHRTTHNLKSLTLLLSLASGADIADLQGQRARVTIPLNNLEYDGEPGLAAWFYSIVEMQLGGASTPAPSGIALRETGKHIRTGSDGSDPRASVVSRLVFDLEFSEDAAGFENIPLVVKGFHAASNAPATFSLPVFVADEDAAIEVTDSEGGAVGLTVALEVIGGFSPTTISGEETIVGLAEGSEPVCIVVDHAESFALCEYPRTDAPVGVEVTVIASGEDGNNTTGGQFVLKVENKNFGNDYDYGGSPPDIVIGWTRTGTL